MIVRRAWPVAVACCLAGAAADAQTASDPPPDCSGKAGRYASEKAGALWVVRRGALTMGENPLRPLSRDEYLVLQVVVKGRLATAWGPDETSLRQGGAPRDVEREGIGPIRWQPDGTALPNVLRVIGEDGTVLAGPMRLVECGDAPAAKAVAPAATRRPAAKSKEGAATRAPAEPAALPPGLSLPQGAIR